MTTTHKLVLLPSGRQGEVPTGITLLDAAKQLGVDIESICGGHQVCGKCLVCPQAGNFPKHGVSAKAEHVSPPDTVEAAYAAQHDLDLSHIRLGCAAKLLGDLVVDVPERSLARKQVIRKQAGELKVEVNPAVTLAYVDVEPAQMGNGSDWQRVQDALREKHGLTHVRLDPLLLPQLQTALRDGGWALTVTLWQNHEVIALAAGYSEAVYGLAVDLGSTTVVGHLCDLRTGAVLATESVMNPQVRYGEDLMSRVSYGMMNVGGVDKMHRSIIKALNTLAKNAAGAANISPKSITDTVIVCNTVMHHILLNIDPVELGGAPFALATADALDMKARDLGLTALGRGAMVHLLPNIAGHVGADNAAVLLSEQAQLDDQTTLIVDIGTNAEILLGTQTGVYSASSPTGPAFEGAQIQHGQRAAIGAIERVRIDRETGQVRYKVIGDERWSHELGPGESLSPTGICGSGIIEAIVELFLVGLIDAGGLFVPNAADHHPAVRQRRAGKTHEIILAPGADSATEQDIVVTQQDIRAVQLAKGALYAGVRLLMDHMGVETVDRVKLAGAFGSYIDPVYAMLLGLIPDCDLSAVSAIGNAAGDGARVALLNLQQRQAIQSSIANRVHYVETAVEPRFQEHFVEAMGIPHATAAYPHLADYLALVPKPEQPAQPETGRRRRNRRRSR